MSNRYLQSSLACNALFESHGTDTQANINSIYHPNMQLLDSVK